MNGGLSMSERTSGFHDSTVAAPGTQPAPLAPADGAVPPASAGQMLRQLRKRFPDSRELGAYERGAFNE